MVIKFEHLMNKPNLSDQFKKMIKRHKKGIQSKEESMNRNRYNKIPHPTQNTEWESNKQQQQENIFALV